jgi:DNA excision repair protein ERCC-2
MIFTLDDLTVYFPFPKLYHEQYAYMRSLKLSLDSSGGLNNGGHALLEMPTGTGKTVCLLSLVTSYQMAYAKHPTKKIGKLVYCTRTVPEMDSVMEEVS